jgi:hypothetical protein
MAETVIDNIIKKINTEKRKGYEGIDINLKPIIENDDTIMREVKNYFIDNNYKFIDWKRDDPCGKGIGINIKGNRVSRGITITWY